MRRHVLVLTAAGAILAFGANATIAQAPPAETPSTEQSPTAEPNPGDPSGMMGGHPGMMWEHGGVMGNHPGMMGMIGRDYGHRDWNRQHGMIGPVMARIIFSLMDADGDGKLTLQEWQAAHERIFKAMDTDHDGTVTLEEMQAFMRGVSRPASPQ